MRMVSISLLAAEYAPSHSHTIIGAATARRALAHRLNRERPRPQDSSFPSGRSDTQPVPAGGEVKTNGVWALLSGIAVSPVGRRGFASPFEVGPQLRWFLGRQGSCSRYSHRSKSRGLRQGTAFTLRAFALRAFDVEDLFGRAAYPAACRQARPFQRAQHDLVR